MWFSPFICGARGWRVIVGLCILAAPNMAVADLSDRGWITITEENNNLGSNQDRYYVNGFNIAYLSGAPEPERHWDATAVSTVEGALPWLFADKGQRDRRYEWTVLGQQIFTPANKSAATPDPKDRPYAGWLYTGIDLLQDDDGLRLDDLSATIGVVGSAALGRQLQNGFHKIFGYGSANGWSHQLRSEPALTVGYSRRWRFAAPLSGTRGAAADIVPELGAMLGNVQTYVEASTLLRLGWGLDSSYGPKTLSPGLSGGGYFNPDRSGQPWGLYAFAGVQGRGIGHDLFLDGNTYQSSPSVTKYPWVHDEVAGLSWYGWRWVSVDFSYVRRSEQFHGQQGAERFGSATLLMRW